MSAYDLAVVARNALAVPEIADTAKLIDLRAHRPGRASRASSANHNDGFLTDLHRRDRAEDRVHEAGQPHARHVRDPQRPHDDRASCSAPGTTPAGPAACSTRASARPPTRPAPARRCRRSRAVTADQRRAAFAGLPRALGGAGARPPAAANAAAATRDHHARRHRRAEGRRSPAEPRDDGRVAGRGRRRRSAPTSRTEAPASRSGRSSTCGTSRSSSSWSC